MNEMITIDCNEIRNWKTFHDVFAKQFGFPEFYGRNMNAWIDCMTSIDTPEDGMTSVHCAKGSVFTIALLNVNEFRARDRELYDAIVECSSFVNYRRIRIGEAPVLVLSFQSST